MRSCYSIILSLFLLLSLLSPVHSIQFHIQAGQEQCLRSDTHAGRRAQQGEDGSWERGGAGGGCCCTRILTSPSFSSFFLILSPLSLISLLIVILAPPPASSPPPSSPPPPPTSDDVFVGELLIGDFTVTPPEGKITCTVYDSAGVVIHNKAVQSEGKFAHTASKPGEYKMCFHNTEGINPKTINLSVTSSSKDYKEMAKKDNLKPLEMELKRLEDTITQIHTEMRYLQDREGQMRETNGRREREGEYYSYIQYSLLYPEDYLLLLMIEKCSLFPPLHPPSLPHFFFVCTTKNNMGVIDILFWSISHCNFFCYLLCPLLSLSLSLKIQPPPV